MIRQYFTSPFMGGYNPLHIGTIAAGSIYYLQNDGWWRDRYRGRPVCREPWIVEAFLNGTLGAARRDPRTGFWQDLYISGRSDLAVVRSLRNGKRRSITVRVLRAHDDAGLTPEPTNYPDRPSDSAIQRYLERRAGTRPRPPRSASRPT